MKKGSPEAKAWGKRMRTLRKKEKSQKVNKPVSVKSHKVSKMSKKERRHGKKGTTFHVVPDVLYAGAAVELLGPAAENVYAGYKAQGASYALNEALPWSLGNQVMPAIVPAAEIAVLGIVIQKVAKYMGLNKIGTKDIKVL
jgi:hypothetical protein